MAGNLVEYAVSEISQALKRTVEDAFGRVCVRGEISGAKAAGSGHFYFSLKDASSTLDCVCWRGARKNLKIAPEDGLEVRCVGKLTTFPGRSKYQLVVESAELAGAGALMALLEKRKAQLEKEGLFAPERKKRPPFAPRAIGLITSPTGAALRDMLHRIEERFPLPVALAPCLVQGEGAAEQLARALVDLDAWAQDPARPLGAFTPEVIVLARGGGSIEDLWAFNDEALARAVAAAQTPVITGVGHETDTTLVDFVGDLRAPTPTAAIEFALPVRSQLETRLDELAERAAKRARLLANERGPALEMRASALARARADLLAIRPALELAGHRLSVASSAVFERARRRLTTELGPMAGPGAAIEDRARAIERLGQAAALSARDAIDHSARRHYALSASLPISELRRLGKRAIEATRSASERVASAFERERAARLARLDTLGSRLASLDPRRRLRDGYAIVREAGGGAVTTAAAARAARALEIEFADGMIEATVGGGRRRAKKSPPEAQERLI